MDLIRELNLNYATIEKDLTRYISRLTHLDSSESDFFKVGEYHAASQIESNYEKEKLTKTVIQIRRDVTACNYIISSLNSSEAHPEHTK